MKEYLKRMVDEKDPASSKIFMGFIFGAITIICIALKIIIESIPMDILYFVGGLTLSFFGLSSVERFRNNNG